MRTMVRSFHSSIRPACECELEKGTSNVVFDSILFIGPVTSRQRQSTLKGSRAKIFCRLNFTILINFVKKYLLHRFICPPFLNVALYEGVECGPPRVELGEEPAGVVGHEDGVGRLMDQRLS